MIGVTRTWARELGRYGIRVNAVAPGFVATEILRDMPQKVLDSMVEHTPLGRIGRPEDIANAYAWLRVRRGRASSPGTACRSTAASSSGRSRGRPCRGDNEPKA